MTTRQEKVNSVIQRELGQILLEESYEGITGLMTITQADVTADLSEANVYFSVVGQDEEEVLKILNNNIYKIQGLLNKKLVMRKLPRISFVVDQRSEVEQKINKLIDESGTTGQL